MDKRYIESEIQRLNGMWNDIDKDDKRVQTGTAKRLFLDEQDRINRKILELEKELNRL